MTARQHVIVPKGLRTPRAAAIAGVLSAVLLAASLVRLRLSVSSDMAEAGKWLAGGSRRASAVTGLYLIPFAGIAFLWFMGVIRDQMGEQEDKFFATVFMGSGLLFVALLFAAVATAIGLLSASSNADILPPVTSLRPLCPSINS